MVGAYHVKLQLSWCIVYTMPCHFMQSHIHRVLVCLAVTCHLHFWHNDQDLLCATMVTRGGGTNTEIRVSTRSAYFKISAKPTVKIKSGQKNLHQMASKQSEPLFMICITFIFEEEWGKDEVEWTSKAEIWKTKLLTAGKAIFWPSQNFEKGTLNSSGYFTLKWFSTIQ